MVERHIVVLSILVDSGPTGVIEIANELGHSTHKIRYSLRTPEEENLIEPTAEGAKPTDRVLEWAQQSNEQLDVMSSRLRQCVDAFGATDSRSIDDSSNTDEQEEARSSTETVTDEEADDSTDATSTATDEPEATDTSIDGQTPTASTPDPESETTDEKSPAESTAVGDTSQRDKPSTTGGQPTEVATEPAAKIPNVSTVESSPQRSLHYNDFKLEGKIGHGGSAVVYQARYSTDEQPVALKMPDFDGTITMSIIESFEHEAETWSQLSHRVHVVGVVDSGTTPKPWIAMELMDGGTLRERIGELSIEQAIWTCERVAQAVRHDRHGVAHHDLKPDNVLFRRTGSDTWDVPKVADWGLAKMLRNRQAAAGEHSPTYAAPEQLDPEAFGEPDSRTDIYQLGALTYELLTGRQPFEGDEIEVLNAILRDNPEPPRSVTAAIPESLSETVMTALRKDPDNRFSTVERFQSKLQNHR